MLNLDTHILLHALGGELSGAENRLLTEQPWGVSGIVLWEIAKLAQLGRITIPLDSPRLLRLLRPVHVWPIDLAVCRAIDLLDFRADPADELIAATSIAHQVPLLTRDRAIRKSKCVPLA